MKRFFSTWIFLLALLSLLSGCGGLDEDFEDLEEDLEDYYYDDEDDADSNLPTYRGLVYTKDFYDTDVVKKSFRVYSKTNLSNDNRVVFPVKLPENTIYWGYWFAVSQGDEDPFAYAVRNLSATAAKITNDPLTALGLGLISHIPALQNNTETLDLYVTNESGISHFYETGYVEHYYQNFGLEENAINVYRVEKDNVPTNETMYFCVYNDNFTKGVDAYLQVVAFVLK